MPVRTEERRILLEWLVFCFSGMTRANYEHHEAALPPKDLKREQQMHHGSAKLGFLVAIVGAVLFALWSPALVSLRPVLVRTRCP
jgi:hypothetical protein